MRPCARCHVPPAPCVCARERAPRPRHTCKAPYIHTAPSHQPLPLCLHNEPAHGAASRVLHAGARPIRGLHKPHYPRTPESGSQPDGFSPTSRTARTAGCWRSLASCAASQALALADVVALAPHAHHLGRQQLHEAARSSSIRITSAGDRHPAAPRARPTAPSCRLLPPTLAATAPPIRSRVLRTLRPQVVERHQRALALVDGAHPLLHGHLACLLERIEERRQPLGTHAAAVGLGEHRVHRRWPPATGLRGK